MLSEAQRTHLRLNRIAILEERIERLDGTRRQLREIVFRDGGRLKRSALFFDTPASGQSKLAESVGCQFDRHGGIKCGAYEATSVPGVFAAGNIIKDVQLAIVAAAEGTRAAFGINRPHDGARLQGSNPQPHKRRGSRRSRTAFVAR